MCDQISDAILDAIIKDDPSAKVAAECFTKTGFVVVGGEVSTTTYVDVQKIARDTILEIGYDKPEYGFEGSTCGVLAALSEQSPEIAQGVNEGEGLYQEQGAGDQGLMFGFACNETTELMPLSITVAHKLTQRLASARKRGEIWYLRPDAKSQVTVEYENNKPKRIDTVVISTQHHPDVDLETIRRDMIDKIIKPICGSWVDEQTKYFINPTGKFVIGGPVGDAGLTGRKIIVDTYGGHGRHGGGCFSGKDPSKVDRSASYYARYVAKNIVAAGLAEKCEVQVAYAIGVADPVSILVDTFGTGKIPNVKIVELVKKHFNFKPKALIDELNLRRPIYKKTAAYGHFGRNDPDFTWEQTNKADLLRQEAGLLLDDSSCQDQPEACCGSCSSETDESKESRDEAEQNKEVPPPLDHTL